MKKNAIIVNQVFEEYPLFYLPYIPPVIDLLNEKEELDIQIIAYKGSTDKKPSVTILPNYNYRFIVLKMAGIFNSKIRNFSYLEYKSVQKSVDIIHIQHSFLFSKVLALLNLPKEKRPKIVVTLRGGDTYIKPWLEKKWKNFYEKKGQNVDAFITMSQHQKRYLQKWGIKENKIHVIPISFGDKSIAKSKSPSSDSIKIISAFRMCWEKNIDSNLRVLKLLIERGVNVKYDIFGDGPDSGQVHYLIDKYELNGKVIFHGKIPNQELKKILPKYDFFLQLSLSEAFPTTILEAQSFGIPCIVSNSGGLPEAVINGESGYCVNTHDVEKAADYIIELYENHEKYRSFSKRAIEYVNENFTLSHESNKLIELYKSLSKNSK